jgi:hypothetical protein
MLPVKSGGLWGIIHPSGKEIAPARYNAVPHVTNRQAVVVLDGKYGLIDSTGKLLIQPIYTFIDCINEDLVLTNMGGDCQGQDCEGGKWGLINLKLGREIPPTYHLIARFDSLGQALVNIGGKCGYDTCDGGLWGIIDTTAQELLPARYKVVTRATGSEVNVQGDAGWGLYDWATRQMVIPPQYEKLQRISRTHVAILRAERWGVLNNRGQMVVDPAHDEFRDAGLGYLAYRQGLVFGLMDSTGRILFPPKYDRLQVQPYGWVIYHEKTGKGLTDTTGRVITTPFLVSVDYYAPDFCLIYSSGGRAINRLGTEIISHGYHRCFMANDSTIVGYDPNYLRWYDTKGKPLKTMTFEELDPFDANKVARAKIDGQWGLLNTQGEWIIPPKYEEVKVYLHTAKARKGEDWSFFYFDENGRSSKVKRIVLIKDNATPSTSNTSMATNIGWFLARNLWGLRDMNSGNFLIDPKYQKVEVIPGTNVTLVWDKIKGTEDRAWAMVDHTSGKQLCDPLFEKVYTRDWFNNPLARVIYAGSGKYALLSLKGQTTTFDNAAYIGPFNDSLARINLGGRMEWSPVGGIDTILSMSSRDRFTNEIKTSYQYCSGGKWGYIDRNGKWARPVEYQCALDFDGGLARIRVKDKWGAVDRNFNVVVQPRFDFIERLFAVDGRTIFAVGEDRTAYGFIDQKGEITIKPRFQDVGQFSEGLVKVREGDHWGFANRNGEVVIPPQFITVGDFHEGRARVRNNRAWGYIDTLGNSVTPQKYLRSGDFKEGLAWVQTEKFFGFIDPEGNMAIQPEYSAVGDFSEGLAPAKRKGVYGLIDKKGNWVVQPHYYRIGSFKDSVAVIQEKGEFGLITPKGDFLVKPGFKEIAQFSEGLVRFKSGMEYGFMDPAGAIRIENQYSNAGDFSCGRAAIFVQGRWGFIDSTGTQVVTPKYPKVNAFVENRAAVRLGKKWGFIDLNGGIAVPIVYDKVSDFKDGRAAVYIIGEGWGFVNATGTQVIPCQYDEVGFRQEGIISVKKDNKWGLINAYGAVMTPCKYDMIGKYSQGLASAMLRRSIGVVDGQGKVLLEPQYDTVRRVGDLIQVEDDDAIGYIDLQGKWIWQLRK